MIYHVPNLGKPVSRVDGTTGARTVHGIRSIRVSDQLHGKRDLRDTILIKHVSEVTRLNDITE